MRHKKLIIRIVVLSVYTLIYSWGVSLHAQQLPGSFSGIVSDEFGKPLEGVIIYSENGKNGTSTNSKGEYNLTVNDQSEFLIFYASGYASKKVAIQGNGMIDITLNTDIHKLDEIVQLGYTSQRRREISGAVATISGDELEKSPVANLSQTLAGRLSGLTAQETYSELSRTNTNLYIRGVSAARNSYPLVVIDGIITSYESNESLEFISPHEIESITILKDASTEALYGIQGANGLIVVTTKRGQKGSMKLKTYFDQSLQEVITKPAFYSSADYAEMRNQAAFNDGLGLNYFFTDQQISKFRSGNNELYPNNNWYEKFMKDYANMQRFGINAMGGNDWAKYFANINIMNQGGQFISEQTRYNPSPNYFWLNFRSNVDMRINDYLSGFVRLSGNIRRERTSGVSNSTVYSSLFMIPPTIFGPVTPGNVIPAGEVITTDLVASPTYGLINRTGYIRRTVTNVNTQFGINLDMSFLTKGLCLSGIVAYQTNAAGSLSTTQNYERYIRTGSLDTLLFAKKGSDKNTPLAYGKNGTFYYHLTYNTAMSYQRDFGKHSVSGISYMFYQRHTRPETTSPYFLPYTRLSSGIEATYGFDNKYFIKLDAGYSGSEAYGRESRFTLTPAVSAAWLVSSERFMEGIDWLSNLKFRASYGKAANDQSGLDRFSYADNVLYYEGGQIGYLQYTIDERQVGNPYISAEVSVKQNYGIDLGLFNSISVSVDMFKERMENMVIDAISAIPLYQGIPATSYPKVNAGIFENKGYEITANYIKAVNKDLSVSAGIVFSQAINTVVSSNEALKAENYAYRKWEEGYPYGQEFGYLVDYSNGNGFFNSSDEIASSGLTYDFGTPRVGDLIYKDLNNDNNIDERDKAPIGHGAIPRKIYGISGGVTYKSFELSLLFEGVGDYSTIYNGIGVYETSYDGVFGSLHGNAWTQARYNSGDIITYPALSLAKTVNHEANDFFSYDRSYLRLKNVQLSYNLPASLAKFISAERIEIVLRGQNLITWDKMKSDDFGPENTYSSFPVYRVYSFGLSVVF